MAVILVRISSLLPFSVGLDLFGYELGLHFTDPTASENPTVFMLDLRDDDDRRAAVTDGDGSSVAAVVSGIREFRVVSLRFPVTGEGVRRRAAAADGF
ncbi:hypothetical protein M5689_022745 [Euphorbia peplus]|nr:hypothetical protein M5689_022745 [Euphorbia peplus]